MSAPISSPHLYRPRSTSLPYPTMQPPPPISTRFWRRLGAFRNSTARRRPRECLKWRTWLNVTNVVRVLWVLCVYWGERKVFDDAIEACEWDNWERWPAHATPHRLVLIADPQLVDPHTYPRRGIALWATMFYTDKFMARSYSLLQSQLVPATTIFLGDLFDGGREWSTAVIHHVDAENPIAPDPAAARDWKKYKNDYWLKEAFRFDKLFPALEGRRTIRSLPGNHDLGLGNGIKESVSERFRSYFGETSRVLTAGNHSLVLLDTVSLSNERNPRIYNPPQEFLASLPQLLSPADQPLFEHSLRSASAPPPLQKPTTLSLPPTILLTHVPLYRSPSTPCGPLRESPNPIPIHAGYQYQNVLTAQLSAEILEATNAKWIFSGDDHDFCEVEHMNTGGAREITVKSFSWAMGVRKPGFLAVSLWKEREDYSRDLGLQWKLCLLPDQIGIFFVYLELLAGSLVLLLLAEVFTAREDAMLLPVMRENNGRAYAAGEGEDDGTGKYRKPIKAEVSKWKAVGTGVVDELRRVAVVALGWYFWLIWRW